MRLQNAKRITLEGVPSEQQQAVSEIALVVNTFMEDVVNIINGNVGFDNLSREIISFPVQTDNLGNVKQAVDIKTRLSFAPRGCNVCNIMMTDNPQQVPNITNTPFVCFTPLTNNSIRITKILNLQKNTKYTIFLEIF